MAQEADDLSNAPETASSWECLLLPGLSIPIGELASTTMQLQLVVVYFLTQALHHCIFKHVHLPPLVSQMIAGVILSPSAFYVKKGGVCEKLLSVIFPELSATVWKTIAWLGCALSSFIINMKIDFSIMFKTGQKAYILGFLGLFLPFGINAAVAYVTIGTVTTENAGKDAHDDVITTASITAMSHFPVIACLLTDLDLLNSELGRLAMSASLLSEMGSIFLYIFGKPIEMLDIGYLTTVSGPIAVVLLALLLLRPLMNKMIKLTPKDRPVKTSFVMLVFFFGIVSGVITDYTSDQRVILGVFIIGAITPAGPPLASAFVDVFDFFVSDILQPFFITATVMRANVVTVDFSDRATWQQLTIAILPNLVKISMCVVCAICAKMSIGDGVVLGLLLSAKGFVDLGLYAAATEGKRISRPTFTLLVFWAILAATIIPLLVKRLYNPSRKYIGYQKRDIMHLKQNSDLKLLACIYRSDNAGAITSLLDMFSPTKNNPIDAYILHLVKLTGTSHPTFISHDIQTRKSTSHRSHSEEIVMAFNRYQGSHNDQTNNGGLTTHLFTIVTLQRAMHEGICTLAIDNLTSLIVLPFHRKLRIDGSVDSEHHDQRMLNLSVLNHAPCSVVVHINRGLGRKAPNASFNQAKSNYSESNSEAKISVDSAESESDFAVAVVFIGGDDDREAVALAKWMAKGARVRIHLLKLISAANDAEWEGGDEDHVDTMVIQEIRQGNSSREKFSYEEQFVKDGSETSTLLKAMANDFDLMVVGRRNESECQQTAGLKEWSEMPELGVIGDLLASPDLQCRCSVLVVQRQKQR